MLRFRREDKHPPSLAIAQQKELLERERLLARDIERLHVGARASIERRILSFIRRIERAQERGEVVREWWLYELGRLDALMAQWDAWAKKVSAGAYSFTNPAMSQVAELAQAHLRAMGTAIGTSFNALPRHAILAVIANTRDGTPLQERFLRAGVQAAAEARQAIVNSLTYGQNPRTLGKQLVGILDTTKSNAQVIARTETMRVYRQVDTETYRLNGDIVARWRWLATLDSRVCPICLAMHGTEHPLSEPFVSHPSCRCTTLAIMPEVPIDYGKTGQQLWNDMGMDQRAKIFGKIKAKLITDNAIPLKQMVYKEDNKWGGTLRELTLTGMKQRSLATSEQIAAAIKWVRANR